MQYNSVGGVPSPIVNATTSVLDNDSHLLRAVQRPNAFKASFILSSPFSPPQLEVDMGWQQAAFLGDEGRKTSPTSCRPSTLENARWKFLFCLPHCPGVGEGSPFDVPIDACQFRGATSSVVFGHLAEVSGEPTPGPRPTSTL